MTNDHQRDRSHPASRAAADTSENGANRLAGASRAAADICEDPPPRRSGARCGYPGQGQFGMADARLRRALSVLARDADPAARVAGAEIAEEATNALHAVAERAERASTAWKRAQDRVQRLSEQLDRQLARHRPTSTGPDLDPPPAA